MTTEVTYAYSGSGDVKAGPIDCHVCSHKITHRDCCFVVTARNLPSRRTDEYIICNQCIQSRLACEELAVNYNEIYAGTVGFLEYMKLYTDGDKPSGAPVVRNPP